MVKSRIILLISFILLVGMPSIVSAAGGSRLHNGVLRRLWEDRLLPAAADQSQSVDQFIQQNRRLLGLNPNQQIQLRRSSITSCALGWRYIHHQYAYGLPVFGGELVLVAQEKKIKSLFNSLVTADFPRTYPRLTHDEALRIGHIATDNGRTDIPPQVELGYTEAGNLIYVVRLSVINPPASWELWIDAVSGVILEKSDRRQFVDGTGRIFDPDPKTALECDTLHDWNNVNWAIPETAYDTVTLRQLDDQVGEYYYLEGPFVSDSATANRAHETTPNFFYSRADSRFEAVMVYFHIDREQRYFQDYLQSFNANNRQQVVNVNGTGEDDSWYSPFSRIITYGSGGVDDAEDADVILHEYGHAVQDDIHPGQYGGHAGAMGEGFGDYLAGSYSLMVNNAFHPEWVFTWDGHNQFWAGRYLNRPYHYPNDLNGNIYHDGEMWSAGLIDVWWDMPDRVAWDRIVLQHHFLLGQGPLIEDAAEAILTTELGIYGGQYREIIIQNFGERGFINPAQYYPAIATTPLPDTEDTLQTQFEVVAQITSQIPLELASLLLFWRTGSGVFTPVTMLSTGISNQYHAFIPGPFSSQMVSYYLTAADTIGMASFAPANAPAECYQFYVGPDLIPPQVVWTDSLGQTIFLQDSLLVRTVVTDNTMMGSVLLIWQVDQGGPIQNIPMTFLEGDTFQAYLTYACQTYGQSVFYHVRATDGSSQGNVADGPEQMFTVSTTALLDDFEGPLGAWVFTGQWGLATQFSHSPGHSLEDSPGTPYLPNSDTWAQWGDSWDLSSLTTARLKFWEWHRLQLNHDYGRLEISSDSGPWQSLLEVTGLDTLFRLREVSLDAYCGGVSHDLRARFRVSSDDSTNFLGWFIDDVALVTSPIVPVVPSTPTSTLPNDYKLDPVQPNPFNISTIVRFHLPAAERVSLKVYDIAGNLVRDLLYGERTAGSHQIAFNGSSLASGLYFVRLQAGDYKAVRKMVLIK